MAQITEASGPSIKRAGVTKQRKLQLRIDMTPMVDLGFLLISFFIMTTELSKPTAMNLYMPKDGPESPLRNSDALTVLIDDNQLYYYEGNWEEAFAKDKLYTTTLTGNESIRKVLERKQQALERDPKNKEGRNGLMVIIKPAKEASYKMVVDMLDEMTISMVKKYAIVKISDEEIVWIKAKKTE